jgi:hypothetical protein
MQPWLVLSTICVLIEQIMISLLLFIIFILDLFVVHLNLLDKILQDFVIFSLT